MNTIASRKKRRTGSTGARFLSQSNDSPLISYKKVIEFPEFFEDDKIFVIYEKTHPWAAAMKCPCGCGDNVYINLSKKYQPQWKLKKNSDDCVSIYPSIRRTVGCQSHFLIIHGRIISCYDED